MRITRDVKTIARNKVMTKNFNDHKEHLFLTELIPNNNIRIKQRQNYLNY